jgi:hypothetical protein
LNVEQRANKSRLSVMDMGPPAGFSAPLYKEDPQKATKLLKLLNND